MCVAALNAGRRQATRHWHGSDSSNWYWCMCVCVCVYTHVCACASVVLCSTDLFSGSRVYMHGHGSRTGLVWCWSRTLSPSSSTTNPPPPPSNMGTHTYTLVQTHTTHTASTYSWLSHISAHSRFAMEWNHMCSCSLLIRSGRTRQEQLTMAGRKMSEWILWFVFLLFQNFKFLFQNIESGVHTIYKSNYNFFKSTALEWHD